jgi:hypothetical protein
MAELWRLIVEYVGPERYMAELDVRALMVDRELYDHVDLHWSSEYGCVPDGTPHGHRSRRPLVWTHAEAADRDIR